MTFSDYFSPLSQQLTSWFDHTFSGSVRDVEKTSVHRDESVSELIEPSIESHREQQALALQRWIESARGLSPDDRALGAYFDLVLQRSVTEEGFYDEPHFTQVKQELKNCVEKSHLRKKYQEEVLSVFRRINRLDVFAQQIHEISSMLEYLSDSELKPDNMKKITQRFSHYRQLFNKYDNGTDLLYHLFYLAQMAKDFIEFQSSDAGDWSVLSTSLSMMAKKYQFLMLLQAVRQIFPSFELKIGMIRQAFEDNNFQAFDEYVLTSAHEAKISDWIWQQNQWNQVTRKEVGLYFTLHCHLCRIQNRAVDEEDFFKEAFETNANELLDSCSIAVRRLLISPNRQTGLLEALSSLRFALMDDVDFQQALSEHTTIDMEKFHAAKLLRAGFQKILDHDECVRQYLIAQQQYPHYPSILPFVEEIERGVRFQSDRGLMELAELDNVLYLCTLAMKKPSLEHANALFALSKKVSGYESSEWKQIGIALTLFSCAMLFAAVMALAFIPTMGLSISIVGFGACFAGLIFANQADKKGEITGLAKAVYDLRASMFCARVLEKDKSFAETEVLNTPHIN